MNSRITTAFEELFKNADKLTNDQCHDLFKKLAGSSPERPNYLIAASDPFIPVTQNIVKLYENKKMPIAFCYEMAKILLDKQHDFETVKKVFVCYYKNFKGYNGPNNENFLENYENIIKFLSQYKQFKINEDHDFYGEITKILEQIYKFLQVRCSKENYIESEDTDLQASFNGIEKAIKKIAILKNAGVKFNQRSMLFLMGAYSHLLIKNTSTLTVNREAILETGKNKFPVMHALLIQLNQVLLNTDEIFELNDTEWLKKLVAYNTSITYKYHFNSFSDLTINEVLERGAYWNCSIKAGNEPDPNAFGGFKWQDLHFISIIKTNKSINQLPPIPNTDSHRTRGVSNYQATSNHPNSSQHLISSVDASQSLPAQQLTVKDIYALIRFLSGEASKIMLNQHLVIPASFAIYEFNDQITLKDSVSDKKETRTVKCITGTLLNDSIPPFHFSFDEHHVFIPIIICDLQTKKAGQPTKKQITYLCADLRNPSLRDDIKMQFLDAMPLPSVKKALDDSYSVNSFEKTILEKFTPHLKKLFDYINSTGETVTFDVDLEKQQYGYNKIIIRLSKTDKSGQSATGTLTYDLNELLSQIYKNKNNLTLGTLIEDPNLYLNIHTLTDDLLAKLDLAFRFDVTRLLGLDDLIIKINEALLTSWKVDAANTFSPISLSAIEPLVLTLRIPLANKELQTISIPNIEKCFDRTNLIINHDAILQSIAISLANLFMFYVKNYQGTLPRDERLTFWLHCRDTIICCYQQFSTHGATLSDEDFYKNKFNKQMLEFSSNAENAPPPPVDIPAIIETSKPCKIVLR